MRVVRTNTVWVSFWRILSLLWQQSPFSPFVSMSNGSRVERGLVGRAETDAHSCSKPLAEAGADQMLLETGQEDRKQVSCFRHPGGNSLSHRFKGHGCHRCWLELPGGDLYYWRKSPLSIPQRCAPPLPNMREPADQRSVSPSFPWFLLRGVLLGWEVKRIHFPVFQFLALDQWPPREAESHCTGISASGQLLAISDVLRCHMYA